MALLTHREGCVFRVVLKVKPKAFIHKRRECPTCFFSRLAKLAAENCVKSMKLKTINKEEFPLWRKFRGAIYPRVDNDFDLKEIETISSSNLWHCRFVENESGERIGLVEISLRNIVDGCLSTPVPYLEGLYLVESERNKGRGTRIIEMIKKWCQKKGFSELATDAELTNIEAQRFYEKIGFRIVDRVVEYRLELEKT